MIVNGYRKIVFNKNRITYRNDKKDINVYIGRNDLNEFHKKDLHEVSFSRKDDKEHIIGEDLSLIKAERLALSWIKTH